MSLESIIVIRCTADMIELYFGVLQEINRDNEANNEIRIFDFERIRYVFSNRIDEFVRMRQFDEVSTTNHLCHPNGNVVHDNRRDDLYVYFNIFEF